jgi:amino acid transporter
MKPHAGPAPGSLNRRSGTVTARSPADVAYRRAFLSLFLFMVSFVAAFLVGEGLLSLLAADPEDPSGWQALAAGVPALVVFALPVFAVWAFARRAIRLGRPDARSAVLVAALVALAFAGVNLLSLVAATVLG